MKIFKMAITGFMIVSCSAFSSEKCEALFSQKLTTDLRLDYQLFDQTMGQGWRLLAQNGCYHQASALIEKYIEQNNAIQSSLNWHLFQMKAYSGEIEEALKIAPQILISAEKQKQVPLLWNDYVLANVAFLENDLEKLKYYRNRIAEKAETFMGNKMNLAVVDRLIDGMGKPYKLAYEGN